MKQEKKTISSVKIRDKKNKKRIIKQKMLKSKKWYAIINLYEDESPLKCVRGRIIIIKVPASDEKINTAVTWS